MVLKAMKFLHFWVFEIEVKSVVSIHITLIQCNGLDSNKKFFEKKNCQKKHFCQKNSLKKKPNSDKKIFFGSLEIF